MSAQIFYNNGSSSSEIITHLVNASDGQGLHFNGTSGYIDIASPPDLGTKFSFEFIVQADSWADSAYKYLVDFGTGGRFIIGTDVAAGAKLAIYDNTSFKTFGVSPLDDLKVHHLVVTIDGTAAILYDNGNQIATVTISASHGIDSCTDARIAGVYNSTGNFNGTFYRCRFWNKTLSSADVTSVYESASIDFADQWGVATNMITGAVDKNWGTNQADTGNDTNDRATFNAAYAWNTDGNITDISVASNVLQFTSASSGTSGLWYPTGTLVAGKRYRIVVRTGAISGGAFKVRVSTGSYVDLATLTASSTNVVDFVAPASIVNYIYINTTDAGATIQLNAASISNELVRAGAVADFDLAFANPTQSTIVQDRAGAADGTAAGGVTQISPIEQLNSKALSVGTVASSPANGSIVASGLVGVADSTYSASLYANYTGGIAGVNINAASNGFAIWDNTVERFKIDSGGNVGVGVTPEVTNPAQTSLQIGGNANISTTKAQGASGELDILQNAYYAADGNRKYISTDEASMIRQGGGQFVFRNAPSGTANTTATFTDRLRISSAGLASFSAGIAFSGQTDASGTGITSGASTLNHYETGTWTPILKSGSTTITLSGGNQSATYTRIGNMVTVQWSFRDVTTAGSFENAATKIHGLPFTAGSAKLSQGSVFSIYGGTSFSASPDFTRVDVGTVIVDVMHQAAAAYSSPEIDAVGAGTYGGFTMTYWV